VGRLTISERLDRLEQRRQTRRREQDPRLAFERELARLAPFRAPEPVPQGADAERGEAEIVLEVSAEPVEASAGVEAGESPQAAHDEGRNLSPRS
jgi:hypothetical protein